VSVSPRLWWLSSTLSAVVPGLGQVYNGQLVRGSLLCVLLIGLGVSSLIWVLVTTTLYLWLMLPLLLVALLHLVIITDAMLVSRRLGAFVPGKVNRIWVYTVFSCLVLVLLQLTQTMVLRRCFAVCVVATPSRLTGVLPGDWVLVNRLAFAVPPEHESQAAWLARRPRLLEPVCYLPPSEATTPRIGSFLAAAGQSVGFDGPLLRLDRARTVMLPGIVTPGSGSLEKPLRIPEHHLAILFDEQVDGDTHITIDLPRVRDTIGRPMLVFFSWDAHRARVRVRRIGIPLT